MKFALMNIEMGAFISIILGENLNFLFHKGGERETNKEEKGKGFFREFRIYFFRG
jgi:hypothetical protein